MITYDICIDRNILGSSKDKLFIITNKKIENKKQQQKREKKKERKILLHLFDFSFVVFFCPSYFTSLDYSYFTIIYEKLNMDTVPTPGTLNIPQIVCKTNY